MSEFIKRFKTDTGNKKVDFQSLGNFPACQPGQLLKVTAVDAKGQPTAWEAQTFIDSYSKDETRQVVADAVEPVADKVGDVKVTLRGDLGEDWLLCDGSNFYLNDERDAELYDLLDHGIYIRKVTFPGVSNSQCQMDETIDGRWVFSRASSSNSYRNFVIFDPVTGSQQTATTPDNLNAIGLTWDGDRWVTCCVSGNNLRFYGTDDLVNWTQLFEYTPDKDPAVSDSYSGLRFLFDGVSFRAICQYDGYQAGYLHTVSKDFSSTHIRSATKADIFVADGLFCVGGSTDCAVFEPGGTTALAGSDTGDNNTRTVYNKFAENKYVRVSDGYTTQTSLKFYDKSTNKITTLACNKIFDTSSTVYCDYITFDHDTNELVLQMYYTYSSTERNYLVRLPADADPSQAASYTIGENLGKTRPVDFTNSTHDMTRDWVHVSPYYKEVTGLYPRRLPVITTAESYTYIKRR